MTFCIVYSFSDIWVHVQKIFWVKLNLGALLAVYYFCWGRLLLEISYIKRYNIKVQNGLVVCYGPTNSVVSVQFKKPENVKCTHKSLFKLYWSGDIYGPSAYNIYYSILLSRTVYIEDLSIETSSIKRQLNGHMATSNGVASLQHRREGI